MLCRGGGGGGGGGGGWILFGERAISQLLGLRSMNDCKEYEQLQENPKFKEIVKELTYGLRGVEEDQIHPQRLYRVIRSSQGMVLLHQLCSHPLKARLHSETRPCHTFVCIGQGV